MARGVVLFNFKLQKTVLVEYSHPKRYLRKKYLKKHFLVYSKNNLGAKQTLCLNIKI